MSNAVCHAVTDTVTHAARSPLVTPTQNQNQNQNQTVVNAARGSSVADEIIHRYCLRGDPARRMDGGYAAPIGAGMCLDGTRGLVDGNES